jgi:hypothetical protein
LTAANHGRLNTLFSLANIMNSGEFGGIRPAMGLVSRTALPPIPAKIGLENAAIGSPPIQTQDRATPGLPQLLSYPFLKNSLDNILASLYKTNTIYFILFGREA